MPRPKMYTNAAERQRAYRARLIAVPPAAPVLPNAPSARYRRWRSQLKRLAEELDTLREEMSDYAEDRSERWQESERGAEFEADRDQLETICDSIMDLNMWRAGE